MPNNSLCGLLNKTRTAYHQVGVTHIEHAESGCENSFLKVKSIILSFSLKLNFRPFFPDGFFRRGAWKKFSPCHRTRFKIGTFLLTHVIGGVEKGEKPFLTFCIATRFRTVRSVNI
jgi:hypothetical protein